MTFEGRELEVGSLYILFDFSFSVRVLSFRSAHHYWDDAELRNGGSLLGADATVNHHVAWA